MFQNNTEDVARQKLLLLYILNVTPKSISKDELTEILIDNFNMNFFIIQQYISELTLGSFITSKEVEGKSMLILQDSGTDSLEYFKNKLTEDLIESVHDLFGLNPSGTLIPAQTEATSYPRDNGEINVNLKLVENDETVFSLYISVPSQDQASLLIDKWKDSPDYYYKSIMDLFINNKPTI